MTKPPDEYLDALRRELATNAEVELALPPRPEQGTECELVQDETRPDYVVCKHCGWSVRRHCFYSIGVCPRRQRGWGELRPELEALIAEWEKRGAAACALVARPNDTPGTQKGVERSHHRGEMLLDCARELRLYLGKTDHRCPVHSYFDNFKTTCVLPLDHEGRCVGGDGFALTVVAIPPDERRARFGLPPRPR